MTYMGDWRTYGGIYQTRKDQYMRQVRGGTAEEMLGNDTATKRGNPTKGVSHDMSDISDNLHRNAVPDDIDRKARNKVDSEPNGISSGRSVPPAEGFNHVSRKNKKNHADVAMTSTKFESSNQAEFRDSPGDGDECKIDRPTSEQRQEPADSDQIAEQPSFNGGDADSGIAILNGHGSSNTDYDATLMEKQRLSFCGKSTIQRNDSMRSGILSELAPAEDEDTINVVVRVRPLNAQEKGRGDRMTLQFPGDGALWVDTGLTTKPFTFNVTFEPEANQQDVFENCSVKKLVSMALDGYSCTAFAFGQTGSGKTHTITGPPDLFQDSRPNPELYGLLPRSFQYMFKLMNEQENTTFQLTASFLEIYNEQVIDLLNPSQRKNLAIRWSKNKGFYVENLFVVECESMDDLLAVLEEGLRNRQSGASGVNEHSSRSHSMLSLHIDTDMQDPQDGSIFVTKHGKLTFVDLAGSEKTKTDAVARAEQQVESHNINKSLLVLGKCISSLGDSRKRGGHIPYRDSKLTKLLADGLGGTGVTLMIACVSPSSFNATESMNTLRYANRAKRIKTKPVIKMDPREKLILSLKKEIKILRQENHYLREQLEFPVKPRGQLQRENDNKFLQLVREQKKEGKPVSDHGLYEMLQEYMVENEALRNQNSELHQTRDVGRRELQILARENEKLLRKLEKALGRDRSLIQTPLSIGSGPSSVISRSSVLDSEASPDAAHDSWISLPPDESTAAPRQSNQSNKRSPPDRFQHAKKPPHRLMEPVSKYSNAESNKSKSQGYMNRYQQQQQQSQSKQSSQSDLTKIPPEPGPRTMSLSNSRLSSQNIMDSALSQRDEPIEPYNQYSAPIPNSRSSTVASSRPLSPGSLIEIQEMNERLRLELLELEGEIKTQNRRTTLCKKTPSKH